MTEESPEPPNPLHRSYTIETKDGTASEGSFRNYWVAYRAARRNNRAQPDRGWKPKLEKGR